MIAVLVGGEGPPVLGWLFKSGRGLLKDRAALNGR
jgi:hypothetical protein